MFSPTNNYFEEAAKRVTSSEDKLASDSNSIRTTPGKLETCLLSDKDKQLIHKLVIQALYKSRYNRANNREDANCNTNSVSYKYRNR